MDKAKPEKAPNKNDEDQSEEENYYSDNFSEPGDK